MQNIDKIKPKTKHCQLHNYDLVDVKDPYINIQVKLKGCNADCLFCENKKGGDFNDDIFLNKLKLISEKFRINKINFSGGEPTLNFPKLENLIYKTKELLPDSYIVVNTNGYNLKKLFEKLHEQVNNIQLSRHHYIDEINNKILGFKAPSKELIKDIASTNKDKKHLSLSCNLIKGYIDNKNDIYKYIEDSSSLGIKWIGFVTLIPLNQYSIDNKIEFDFGNERSFLNKCWNSGEFCSCSDYIYIPEDLSEPVLVYNIKRTGELKNSHVLTYDDNVFKLGYSNDIIF